MEQYLQLWKFEQSFQEVLTDALFLCAEEDLGKGGEERFLCFLFWECLIYAAAP